MHDSNNENCYNSSIKELFKSCILQMWNELEYMIKAIVIWIHIVIHTNLERFLAKMPKGKYL